MDFRSDNTHGCSSEVLTALIRASSGTMTSYGGDQITARLRERCCALFETEVDVFPVLTGTAANALSIAATNPATIVCHAEAHVQLEELGAAELFSGGRLDPVAGRDGKLQAETLAAKLVRRAPGNCTVSVTQATEAGTLYTLEELGAVCEVAHANAAAVQMDGARFANAVAALGCAPADVTWRAGVDLLAFGGTKNGTLAAEMIVVFRREFSETLAPLWHRSGHRLSKMRFVSAQLEAYLDGDLWLRNARHANAAAARLERAIGGSIEIVQPVEANVLFVRLPPARAAALRARGFDFYEWSLFGEDVYRIVTAFDTPDYAVDRLAEAMLSK
jgi:threonine aldolase